MLFLGVPSGTGPPPSMGWPRTLNIRPRVAVPTGTSMVLSGTSTARPRARPSLGDSMMQRTVLLPTCWATSITRRPPSFSTVSSSRSRGSSPL